MGGLVNGVSSIAGALESITSDTSALGAITGDTAASSAFNNGLSAAGEAGIANNLQSGEEQLQLQQQEDAVNTALALAGQQEKDNAQNAQKIIGDMT